MGRVKKERCNRHPNKVAIIKFTKGSNRYGCEKCFDAEVISDWFKYKTPADLGEELF